MISSFFPVTGNGIISSLFISEYYCIVYMYPSSVSIHLSLYTEVASLSLLLYLVLLWSLGWGCLLKFCFSLDLCLGMEFLGHLVLLCLVFMFSWRTTILLCYVLLCCVLLCYVLSCCFVTLCYCGEPPYCFVVLCYVVLYYVLLCYGGEPPYCFVMLCYVMFCYVVLCHVMSCYVLVENLHNVLPRGCTHLYSH